jgi:hypothetical protein
MSIKLMTLAWQVALKHGDKLVLLALADNANDEGLCWPSIATIGRKCGMGECTVQRVIGRLAGAGHVSCSPSAAPELALPGTPEGPGRRWDPVKETPRPRDTPSG